MPWSFIVGFFTKGKSSVVLYLAITIATSLLGGYIYLLKEESKDYKSKNDTLIYHNKTLQNSIDKTLQINKDNVQEFEEYKRTTEETYKNLTEYLNQKTERKIVYIEKIKEVENVKKNNDGDVAPVLSDTFKWLRSQNSSSSDKNSRKNKSSESNNTK